MPALEAEGLAGSVEEGGTEGIEPIGLAGDPGPVDGDRSGAGEIPAGEPLVVGVPEADGPLAQAATRRSPHRATAEEVRRGMVRMVRATASGSSVAALG